uniref:MP n=1 Tax=Agave tequilana vitivirus 1 TaxID=2794429 RepID=A0A7T5UFC8_9VIRU|nr:MP [Agave tequilana vitivirus 1]
MTTSEVQVFKVKDRRNGIQDLKEFNSVVDKSKVYDSSSFHELFGPKRIYKSAVCREIEVVNGQVNTEIDLYSDETIQAINEEEYPFMHIGCIALGFMGLGRNMKGEFDVVVRDARLRVNKEICAFRFRCNDRVAAFVDFPDFCVATTDIQNGFTIQLSIISRGLEFLDGTHPLALNLVSVCRFMDDKLESKMLVKKHGKHMYQELCNTEILDPRVGRLQESKVMANNQIEGDTMRDVLETIRIIDERKRKEGSGTDPTERQSSWGQLGA